MVGTPPRPKPEPATLDSPPPQPAGRPRPLGSGEILTAWLPAMVWLGLIAIESTDMLSSEHTSRFLYPLLHFLTGVDLVRFATWHFYIRKGGHFVGYFCLSVLMFRAWRATVPRLNRLWSIPWAALGFVATALVASLDEWHQSFIPSRTGTYKDVVLDSSAALFAQIVIRVVALFGLRLP